MWNVVIGTGFGDEGKGLLTDWLAANNPDAIVVRFNGGAQAGHTVQTMKGERHVFSHFPSGAFAGNPGYLSSFFVCNPLLHGKELAQIQKKGLNTLLRVDPRTPITTPWDMLMNQAMEEKRAGRRHGSCGMGFGETIERSQYNDYLLVAEDLKDHDTLAKKIERIRSEWVWKRASETETQSFFLSECGAFALQPEMRTQFLHDLLLFSESLKIKKGIGKEAVLEGAQGLLLDQQLGYFPHVTRSYTGLTNVVALAKEEGIDSIRVIYATRAYLTRHGAGPLQGELAEPPYPNIVDKTNIENPWQGKLRFALLDADLLKNTISRDMARVADSGIKITPEIAVSCLDQMDHVRFMQGGIEQSLPRKQFAPWLGKFLGMKWHASYGPTRYAIFSQTN